MDWHNKLTLISASAGFGKTTLVTECLHQADQPFTWLSLDEDDNDPVLEAMLAIILAGEEITGGLDPILDRLRRNLM